jgi:hypothetical protein
VAPKNACVGVINGKGEWIIPPRYLQINYMCKTDSFWVKVRESDVSNWWMPDSLHWVGRNTAWKLLNRKGVEMESHLPYLAEPVFADISEFGSSTHPYLLVVRKNWEYGYCEPDGRPITGCHYSFICDVGHGIWLAAETKQDLSEQQMPIVVLDHSGRKLRTLTRKSNTAITLAMVCWNARVRANLVTLTIVANLFLLQSTSTHPGGVELQRLTAKPQFIKIWLTIPRVHGSQLSGLISPRTRDERPGFPGGIR